MHKKNFWGKGMEELYFIDNNECWQWKLSCHKSGYGQYRLNRETLRAHRYFYEVYKGEIPNGMDVHHKCFNRACVNPSHLMVLEPRLNRSKAFKRPVN